MAELNKTLNVVFVKNINSALALNNLEHNSAGFVGNSVFQRVKVVCFCVCKALGKGEEVVVENVLACGG